MPRQQEQTPEGRKGACALIVALSVKSGAPRHPLEPDWALAHRAKGTLAHLVFRSPGGQIPAAGGFTPFPLSDRHRPKNPWTKTACRLHRVTSPKAFQERSDGSASGDVPPALRPASNAVRPSSCPRRGGRPARTFTRAERFRSPGKTKRGAGFPSSPQQAKILIRLKRVFLKRNVLVEVLGGRLRGARTRRRRETLG